MSRIFRNSEESGVANWFKDKSLKFAGSISTEEANRIVNLPDSLSEEQVESEMNVIEACSADKKPYYANAKWDSSSLSKLSEFCLAERCKMIKVYPDDESIVATASVVNNETKEAIKTASQKVVMQKTASASGLVIEKESIKINLADPFRLEEKADMSHMTKATWQENKPAKSLSTPTAMLGSGSVIKIGGGEDFLSNPHLFVRPGQNSIINPTAIETMAKKEKETLSQRIHREAEEKEMAKRAERTMAGKEIAQKATMKDGTPIKMGKVFATESMNAQSGVNVASTQLDIMKKGKDVIPELTEGEKIAQKNREHLASIQRKEQEGKKSWEKAPEAKRPEISQDFFEAIKERMSKNSKK